MKDVRIAELAQSQFNRVARQQLLDLGLSAKTIDRRVRAGRFVRMEEGVFALAPVLEYDELGSWMGSTLTAPDSFLSHMSAGAADGFWSLPRRFETVTRPGSGGPRRIGGVVVYRSVVLDGECTEFRGIPITCPARTLLDLARLVSDRALARAVRDAVRLEKVTLPELGEIIGRHHRRRGTRRLARTIARYAGLPLERARSGAEVRAMLILRDSNRPLPKLNAWIAGEEADLSWSSHRLIVEIDGGPFHLDAGEDARKEAAWKGAGWEVRRLPSDDVYSHPSRLLALTPTNVQEPPK